MSLLSKPDWQLAVCGEDDFGEKNLPVYPRGISPEEEERHKRRGSGGGGGGSYIAGIPTGSFIAIIGAP
jgi:hypothetical protein